MAHLVGRLRLSVAVLAGGLLWSVLSAPLPAQSPEPTVEELEKRALAKLRETRTAVRNKVEFLITSLGKSDEEAAEARRKLVELGRYPLEDERVVAEHLLARMLATSNARTRAHLVRVLQQLAPVLRERADRVVPVLLEAALAADHRLPSIVDVLVALRDPSVKERLAPLLDHERGAVRVAALRLIGRTGDEKDGPRIVAALASPDRDVTLAAIQALRDLGYRKGTVALLPLLGTKDDRVAEAAVDALAFFQAKDAIPALLDALKVTKDQARAGRIIAALGIIGPAARIADQGRVKATLQVYLSSRQDSLVAAAGFALLRLGEAGPEVERALLRNLRDEVNREPRNIVARLEIARILKRMGDYSGSKAYYNKAVREYREILKGSKRSAEYHTNTYIELAGCLARLGQFKAAARYLEKIPRRFEHLRPALKENPDFAEMKEDPQFRRCFE